MTWLAQPQGRSRGGLRELAGEVVAALAGAWEAICGRHDEVPPVVVVAVGSGSRRDAKTVCLGHFAPMRWLPVREGAPRGLRAAREEFEVAAANGDLSAALAASAQAFLIRAIQLSQDAKACRSEVLLTDDGLAYPAAEVLGILLHEATHAVANRRGIKDTSRQGRYHNGRFKALAEQVGLEVGRDPLFGWCVTTLPRATATIYSETLAQLARALDGPHEKETRGSQPSRDGDTLACGCGQWVRSGPKRRGVRTAICSVCRSPLHEQ